MGHYSKLARENKAVGKSAAISLCFPNNLRGCRKGRGISQKEVAFMLHVARSTYAHYETGHWMPTADTLELLCGILQCQTSDVYSPGLIRIIQDLSN